MQIIYSAIMWIVSAFGNAFLKKGPIFSFNLSLMSAYVAAVAIVTAAFYLAIKTAIGQLNLVFPSQFLVLAQPFIPSNLNICTSVCLSSRLLLVMTKFALDFHTKMLDMSKVN